MPRLPIEIVNEATETNKAKVTNKKMKQTLVAI